MAAISKSSTSGAHRRARNPRRSVAVEVPGRGEKKSASHPSQNSAEARRLRALGAEEDRDVARGRGGSSTSAACRNRCRRAVAVGSAFECWLPGLRADDVGTIRRTRAFGRVASRKPARTSPPPPVGRRRRPEDGSPPERRSIVIAPSRPPRARADICMIAVRSRTFFVLEPTRQAASARRSRRPPQSTWSRTRACRLRRPTPRRRAAAALH